MLALACEGGKNPNADVPPSLSKSRGCQVFFLAPIDGGGLPFGTPISVVKLDCEGCEYNVVPSIHDTSFNSIGVLLGRTNWGFIPTTKKPSSERPRDTHRRVRTHYNFARRCKEVRCVCVGTSRKEACVQTFVTIKLLRPLTFFLTRVCSYFLLQCCDFPSLPVKTRLYDADSNGESSGESTVAEVAGEMCKDFED